MQLVHTNIVPKEEMRKAQSGALKILATALENSYGPGGSVTAIREKGKLTAYSKDGKTILEAIKFNRPIEFTMRDDLLDITNRIVTTVGDGTTSAVILSHLIFEELCSLKESGYSENELVETFQSVIAQAVEIIDSNKKECTLDTIYDIAMISTNGNQDVSKTIQSIYAKFGNDVFIDVGISNGVDNILKEYDGMVFDAPYLDAAFITNKEAKTAQVHKPKIYIFEDPIDTQEMKVFMDKIIYDNIYDPLQNRNITAIVPTVIFCPKISADMNATIDQLIAIQNGNDAESRLPISIVANIFDGSQLLDLAKMSGAKTIKKYIDPQLQKIDQSAGLAATLETIHDFAGSADLVESDHIKTKVVNPALMIGPDGQKSTLFNEYIGGLENMLKGYQETKEELTKIGMLKRRINSLKANMVEYLIGGISMTDRDAVRDLVEDAVLNCRSASKHGVGFGANFEGLKAFNHLKNKYISEAEPGQVESLESKLYDMMISVYIGLIKRLYNKVTNESMAEAIAIQGLIEGCPYNIRSKKFDYKVLSSIESEQIILDAISKIIGLVFSTNQYICEAPEYNVYVE